jgi:DUF4097 and DUF4098 domain-containing protein YvlB
MKLDRSIILGLFFGAVAAVSANAQTSSAFQEEFHHAYTLTPGGSIQLKNINGWVKISSWDRNEVKVDALKYAGTRERFDQAKIEVDASPSSIYIRTHYDDGHELNYSSDDPIHNPATVDYTLTVPASARLDGIKLINGNLDIQNVTGDVDAHCINGNLRASGLRGRTDLSTINGALEVTLDTVSGPVISSNRQSDNARDVALKSVNGEVAVTLPSDTDAEVHVRTVHGSISNDFGLPVDDGRYVGHSLAGRLGSGAVRIQLKNVNGPVSIHRASDGKPLSAVQNILPPRTPRETSF